MNINGKITISRITSSRGEDRIEVRLQDDEASVEFATATISLSNFVMAITGLGYVDCDIECCGLKRVGKRMEHKEFVFNMPETTDSNRKEVACETAAKLCQEGWTPDMYFGSKGSFFSVGSQPMARTIIRRWVDMEGAE